MSLSSLEEYLDREFGELPASGLAERAQRRGTSLLAEAPTIRAKAEVDQAPSGIPEWKPPMDAQPEKGGMDRTRLLGSGVVQAAELGVGALEYVARQNKFLRPTVAPAIEGVRQGLAGVREGITSGISEDYLAHVGGELLTLDPDKTIWRGGPIEVADAIYGKFLQSLPSTLLVMLPAARMMRAAQTSGALTYLGASEGTLSLGGIQNNIADEITAMTHEELLKESQRYAQVYKEVGDEVTARQNFTAETQGLAPVIGGVSVAAISMVTGRLLRPVFEPMKDAAGVQVGMGLGKRIGTGFAAEAPQEGSQGAVERIAENAAAQAYDQDRRLSSGVAEAFAQEGLIGGLTGGAVTGAVGQRPQRPPTPLPPPAEDEGGQLGLPGFGPTTKEPGFGIEPEGYRPPEMTPERAAVPGVMHAEQQQDIWPDPGTTEGVMVPPEQRAGQGVLPLGIAGTAPLAERGPGQRALTEVDEPIPDGLDQPTAEPQEDLQAQIEDMRKPSGRSAVYVSPEQGPTDQLQLPKGAVIIPNFDGKGGRLIAKNQQAAQYARERRAEGGSMQAIIGELTMAGTGKPNVRAGYAVQLLDENGAVARESLKATKAEANALKKEWGADGEVRILSGPEALARRSDILEKEQIDLRTEDPTAVAEATADLFPEQPQPLTGAEQRSTTEGIAVRMFDQENNLLDEQVYDTQEEADLDAELFRTDPELADARIVVQPVRTKLPPTKAGVTTTQQIPQRELKGPPEGPPPRPTSEKVAEPKPKEALLYQDEIEEFDETITTKEIEDLPEFDVLYVVASEAVNPDKTTRYDERSEVKSFSTRKAARAFATRARNKAQKLATKYGTEATESRIIEQTSPELESKFQAAVQSRADIQQGVEVPLGTQYETAEAATAAAAPDIGARKELISKWRKKNITVSQKKQFIRRQRASVLRRKAKVKKVRDTPVITRAGQKLVSTKALTYETVSGEETVAKAAERVAAVKEANTRLRYALNRAKKFLGRFETGGEYGVFIAENTDDTGQRTQAARDFLRARDAFTQLTELAQSTLASGNTSNAHAALAKKVAISLERIKLKKMSPDQFVKEFAAISKETEAMMLRRAKVKESVETREEKIEKYNKEQAKAAKRLETLESVWKGDLVWDEIVNPIFRKFSEIAQYNAADPSKNAYYTPTTEEVEALRYAMRTYRKMTERYPTDTFYKPLKAQLTYYGFKFNSDGDVIVEDFSPSDYLLGPGFQAKLGISSQAAEPPTQPTAPVYVKKPVKKKGESVAEYNARVREWFRKKQRKGVDPYGHAGVETPRITVDSPVTDVSGKVLVGARISPVSEGVSKAVSPTAIREAQETAENRRAVQDIRTARALLQRFKDMVAPSKMTITGIKRQEQRFIRGLRKIGAWTDVSPGIGRISMGGFRSRTYRLVGPRLDAHTMNKADAKASVARMNIAMPRELLPVARRMDVAPPRPGEQSAAERMEELVEENNREFFLEELALEENTPALDNAASVVGDMIRDKYSRANIGDVLDAITEALPESHFYHRLAVKLKSMGMSDVTLQFDWAGTKFHGKKRNNYGVFDPSTNRAYLNRRRMGDDKSAMTGAKAIHTILHETLHAATHRSLAHSTPLRNQMFQIRAAAHHAWARQFGASTVPVGLKLTNAAGDLAPIDEFVVEVFADENMQDFLRDVPVEMEGATTFLASAWARIRDAIVEILGWGNVPEVHNLLDAFMSTEAQVFEGAGVARGGSESLDMEAYDTPLRDIAMPFIERFIGTSGILQRVREKGNKAILALTSMEQFVERFTGKLILNGRDLIQEYDQSFRRRNAKAAMHLEVPQELSGRWTKLETTNPEDALAVSQVGTEASLLTIDPRVAVTDEANAHLGEELHADHQRLHSAYSALSTEGKAVFNDALDYYANALETETMFLMQSALRGMLSTSDTPALSTEEFEKKFSIAELKKLKTREDLSGALSEFFEEGGKRDILDTLYKMSMVPRKRQGIYMPMMRYGDDISFAEKAREDVIYEDRKEAMAKRAELLSDDPTLDVGVFPTEEGKFALRTVERVFIMGESVSEVETLRDEMVADPSNDLTADDFFDTQKRLAKETHEAIESNAALSSILKTLSGNNAAQAAIKNFYLRNLSEQSFRKHEIKRKNRKGVRYDLQHRNLATYAKQASYYTAQLEFGWKMSKSLRDMYDVATRTKSPSGTEGAKLTEVVKHLRSRDALSADLPTRNKLVSKSIEATHFFMLASPSYWAINASQPWLVTLPTLGARHGWMASASAMKQFQSAIFKDLAREAAEMKGGLTAFGGDTARVEQTFNIIRQIEKRLESEYGADAKGYVELLEYLRANHIIDINVFTEMRDIAVGKKKTAWDKTIDASRIMAHLTEVNNRVVTALAAYQLELNETGDVKAARDYAGKMVSQTQFNYSAENKPPVFQKAPLLFQFMQWPQHMYAHLIRNYQGMVKAGVMEKSEARSALLGLIGTHAAVGGMTGMMLQPIKWAFGLTLMAFGDEDEPYTFTNAVSGRSYDRMVASLADSAFGTTAATFISKGIPAGLGIDLSTRMSMGTVYFVDLRGDNAQSVLGSMVASFGGATLNQGLKFATGAGKIMDGDVYRGLETMMPKIARDVMRAGRYYNEGLVNNAGDTVIPASEMSVGEVMAQFFGFAPTDISQAYEAQNILKDVEGYNIDRRIGLMRRFRDASTADRSGVLADIKTFNRSNPAERITVSALLQNRRAQRVREARFERYGANIDERKARFYEKYADPYRDE